ncbi:hypothetical protein BH09MYX1_BH09MYX1_17920 [soil metagenome]
MSALAGAAIGASFGACVVGCSLVYPAPGSAPPVASDVRVVGATAKDGTAVRSLYVEGSGATGTLLVQFHGNGQIAEDRLDVARIFVDRGFDVLLVEYRGYGGSVARRR